MDFSIRTVTPSIMRQRGADAYDRGLTLDEHHMNPGAPAMADWKNGWLARHYEVTVQTNSRHEHGCPP